MASARGIEPLSEFEHIPDSSWRGNFRPSMTHWDRGRPAKSLDIIRVAEQLDSLWGSDKLTLYEEYSGDSAVCLFIDYDRLLPVDNNTVASCYSDLLASVVEPINSGLETYDSALGSLSVAQVAISHDCRVIQKEDGPMFKASFHCVWPMVCINKASLIGSMLDELAIPPTADRKVYAEGRRLFRVIGSRKQSNSDSYLQPYGPVLPFHSHLIQHTASAIASIQLRDPDSPPTTRQRVVPPADGAERAAWLRGFSDNDLLMIAMQQLQTAGNGCHNNFQVGKVVGNSMYCRTVAPGRVCLDGTQHDRNNFVLTFRRGGQLLYRCFGSGCSAASNQVIGKWFDGYSSLLQRLDTVLAPTQDLDEGLLNDMQSIVMAEVSTRTEDQARGKGKVEVHHLPEWPKLLSAVVRYINHYWTYIVEIDSYVMHRLDAAGRPIDPVYRSDNAKQTVTRTFEFWFSKWDKNPQRKKFLKLVSIPGKPVELDTRYNVAANLMPNLEIGRRTMTQADHDSIKPILEHQRLYLCGGQPEVFDYWLRWQARIFQHPADKTGVAPLFIGEQGCGKGIICEQLFSRIWQGHYLQANDFDSAIGQFNSHLKHKMVVNLDECCFLGDIKAQDRLKGLITERSWTMEEKFKSRVTLPSYHNYVITTNHEKAVKVPQGERRFFIVNSAYPPAGYNWRALADAVSDEDTVEAYIQYLLSIDTSGFVFGRAPITDAKKQAIAKQRPVVGMFLQALAEDPKLMATGDYDGPEEKYLIKSRASRPQPEQEAYASCLSDEARWEKDLKTIRGQANSAVGTVWTGKCL